MVNTDAITNSDLVDPLADYSPLSSSFRPPIYNNSDSLVTHLKHLVVRNPDSLVSQGRMIKEGSIDILESDKSKATAAASEDIREAPFPVNNRNPRERRPGLGLKRAKFTAKPMPSQPAMCLEPSLDIDNLKDPDELFDAFERMENAKKEMQRRKGQPLMELDQNRATLQPRPRRPGLLGKTATYKHRSYTSSIIRDEDKTLLSSQESNDHRILSPTRADAITETDAMNSSPEAKISDAKPATSSKVSELGELLSMNFDGLDQDGIQSLLLDKLNIKLANIDKLSLPDIPNIRCHGLKDTIYHVDDRNRAASSKPLNFSDHFKKRFTNQVSPSLPKSHLASVSSLDKPISTSPPSKDNCSPLQIDSSPEVISYPEAQDRNVSGDVTSLAALIKNSRSSNIGSKERLNRISNSEQTSKDSADPRRSPARGEENILVFDRLPSPPANEKTADDLEFCVRSPKDGEDTMRVFGEASFVCKSPIEKADQTTHIDAGLESIDKEVPSEGFALEKAIVIGGDSEMVEPLNTQESPELSQKIIFEEIVNEGRKQKAKSKAPAVKEPTKKKAKSNATVVNEPTKKKAKSNATVVKKPTKKKRKLETAPTVSSKTDEMLRRFSLYDAGTKWEAGVRRSTRRRMRPLEYWKGERVLYGRVHKSTVSVIGVKYASPGKDAAEPFVKVKSFVSDKYKNMLDQASSY